MPTATLEQPQTEPRELPLAMHQFDETGTCRAPEVITLAMPKGGICEIRLAADAGGAWYIGYHLAAGKEGATDTYPQLGGPLRATREAALEAALLDAVNFFEASPKSKLHQKCAAAVHTYAIEAAGGASSPANKSEKAKPGPLPEPQNLELPVARLEENPHNPRGEISADDVAELAETIKAQGLLQPVGVRVLPAAGGLPGIGEDNRLELLWGHRRLAAFRSLKRATIPCRVYEGISDEQARLVILIENDERQDLDPIKRARGYAAMMADLDLTQDEVASSLKKSRPVIANALRLLELPEDVQALLAEGKLTTAHGTALCRFKAWPAVCSRIAKLAIAEQASANSLEKDLPFGETLAEEELAVDLCSYRNDAALDFAAVKKKYSKHPDFFIWEDADQYDDFAYCLDLELGKRLLAEEAEKKKAANDAYHAERSGRDEETGELTPAAKRERQKKLDDNLAARLQISTMQDAVLRRLKQTEDLDVPALLVVVREALSHAGGEDLEEIAEQLGIKLPKSFDSALDYDEPLDGLLEINPADLIRIAAYGLVSRDSNQAMRFASEVPRYASMAAREDAKSPVDFESYVAEWEEKILALAKYGHREESVVNHLGCPELVAVQFVRQIRRNLRNAGVPLLSQADADAMDKVTSDELAKIKHALTREQLNIRTTASELGFEQPLVESLARVFDMEKAYNKAFNVQEKEEAKPKTKKAAPAKKAKKGGKRK